MALLIQYFFYKNVAAFTAQVYFAFFNQYSTQTLYDSLCLANFNMVYTALPVFLLGLFEQVRNYRDENRRILGCVIPSPASSGSASNPFVCIWSLWC